ncbi:hypothetical protein [Agrobacterium vaccinii]|uniref:hypothetical protein n=1 Tax=Agrobacterium vaccinii TaxID=2735528 RepID=UPI001E3110EC|nr:hypothetical protein [Agrobacterium vaccinii]
MNEVPGDVVSRNNLNLLGDSVGGLTAPFALIWLIAAVIMQRQELNLTKIELEKTAIAMNEQVNSSKMQLSASIASAKANYKFSLFYKRLALYVEFEELVSIFGDVEHITSDNETRRFMRAIRSSKFMFGDDVKNWLNEIKGLFQEARKKQNRVKRYESKKKNKGGRFTELEKDELELLKHHSSVAESAFLDGFDFQELDRLFEPYVTLPDDINIVDQHENNGPQIDTMRKNTEPTRHG